MIDESTTVGELLERYPEGFSVSPGGTLNRVLAASSHFAAIAANHPVAPTNGGYLVVEATGEEIAEGGPE